MITGFATTVPGTCGVGLFHSFNFPNSYVNNTASTALGRGGIGYAIAGFIDNDRCRQCYDEIKEKYNIVFQSEVKVNQNSNNPFFFILYKRK